MDTMQEAVENEEDYRGQLADVEIRWMIRADTDAVLEIDEMSFVECWSEADLVTTCRRNNTIGMVAEHEDRVVGFIIYELHRGKLNIVRTAVHPDFSSMGVGLAMVQRLINNKLHPKRRDKIEAFVHETNVTAQVFFRALGFASEAIRGDGNGDDEYLFCYRLDGFHEWQGRI
ncbi:GNAT family N-acetyltransferase [Kordiimonas sp.]|uniref:GNAT family N-acetyltransferase n=1 Tax=Kordiimonas sp. TaxID=1970157 RepID=UPI003A8F7BA1